MTQRNLYFDHLQSNYLFAEIAKRKEAYIHQHGSEGLISLGIGDTTEPLPEVVTEKMSAFVNRLSTYEGYSGYGSYQGRADLRAQIAEKFYGGKVAAEDVFISDGSKPDIGRLQMLFNQDAIIALQDPSYPVYIDTSVIMGRSGSWDHRQRRYERIVYMLCHAENDFFPDLESLPHVDVIYFCAPNNPTGMMPNKKQLEALVAYALREGAVIIYDSAYACYIRDPKAPRSIFEIEGAEQVAIETSSFSKVIGFTGVRLGWTVVPSSCRYRDGTKIKPYWERLNATFFNGASNIAQAGGMAVMSEEGLKAVGSLVDYYMHNISLLRTALEQAGYRCYGGLDAPYLWVNWKGATSWEAFEELLQTKKIIATPGVGFGEAGEGFLRLTGFGHRRDIEEAARRIYS